MLHGHTKIELYNVKTGAKKIVEHDNYMTNWLRDVLTPNILGVNILATESWTGRPDFSKAALFGGVVLFENPLSDADADDYLFPQNNKMIAHGCNETYAGSDLTMGNFNSGLSVIGENEATFIWDFTQERGNGTISALGLTNIYGGKAGSGHGKTAADINVPIDLIKSGIWESGNGGNAYTFAYFDETNNKAYFIKSGLTAENKIQMLVCPYNFDEYNPITQKISWTRIGEYSGGTEKEIDVSTYFSTFPGITVYNGKLYMCEASNWAGSNRQFVVYDFEADTITTQTITNATGKTITILSGNSAHSFEIWQNRIYFSTTDSKRVYIDLTDNTDCGVIKNTDNEEITTSGEFCRMWDELFFASSGGVIDTNTQIWAMTNKDHASRRNISGLSVGYWDEARICFGGNKTVAYSRGKWGTSVLYFAVYNFMALQTKNNLDSAVTKTSDMTMRVTYTIREAT